MCESFNVEMVNVAIDTSCNLACNMRPEDGPLLRDQLNINLSFIDSLGVDESQIKPGGAEQLTNIRALYKALCRGEYNRITEWTPYNN